MSGNPKSPPAAAAKQQSREMLRQTALQMVHAAAYTGASPALVAACLSALERLSSRVLERFGFLRLAVLAAYSQIVSTAASVDSDLAPSPLVTYLAGRCDPTAPVRRPPLVRLLVGHRSSACIHEDSDQSALVVSASLGMWATATFLISASQLHRLEAVFRIQQQRPIEEEEGGSLVFRSQPLTMPTYLMLLLHDGHISWVNCRALLDSLALRGYGFHGDRVPDAAPLRCLHRLHPRRLDDSRVGLSESRLELVRDLLAWLLSNGWDCRQPLDAGLQDCALSVTLADFHSAMSAAGVRPDNCPTCRTRPACLADLCTAAIRRRLTVDAVGVRSESFQSAVASLPLPRSLLARCLDGGLADCTDSQ